MTVSFTLQELRELIQEALSSEQVWRVGTEVRAALEQGDLHGARARIIALSNVFDKSPGVSPGEEEFTQALAVLTKAIRTQDPMALDQVKALVQAGLVRAEDQADEERHGTADSGDYLDRYYRR